MGFETVATRLRGRFPEFPTPGESFKIENAILITVACCHCSFASNEEVEFFWVSSAEVAIWEIFFACRIYDGES